MDRRWNFVLAAALLGVSGVSAQTSLVINRIQYVAATGAAIENCTAIRSALAAITDASANNTYLVRLEPGQYDCEGSALEMKSFVDIEGSGQGVTRIFGELPFEFGNEGVVELADKSELRHVTVENTGNVAEPVAIAAVINAGITASLVHVTAISGPTTSSNSCGVYVGATNTVTVRDSKLEGAADGLYVDGAADVIGTQLINGISGGVPPRCVNTFNGSLTPLSATCS